MGGCLVWNISLVTYRMHRLRAFYRSKGLASRFYRLENGSTIRCWVHIRDMQAKKRWGGGKAKGKTTEPQSKPLNERKALLFLHAFGEDGTSGFEHQVATFTRDYRVYIPDLIFFGSSSTTNQGRTESFQADCMHDLMLKLNVKETHVVGTDYGGLVAYWMAARYPEMVQKVVLSSAGVCLNPHSYDSLLRSVDMQRIEDIFLPTTCDGLKLLYTLRHAKSVNMPDFIIQQLLEVYYCPSLRQRRLQILEGQLIGTDKCPALPVLNQDVLIVWGREDRILKLDLAHELRRFLGPRKPQMSIIDGAGHMPQEERPRDFNAIVKAFLDDSAPEME